MGPYAKERHFMRRTGTFILAATLLALQTAQAQDIAGLEDCTKTAGLDKRTGCFQSNIEYLKGVMTKAVAETQQRLKATDAEIAALKAAISGLQKDIELMRSGAAKPNDNSPTRPRGRD
jgi:hypothetical protein